MKDVWNKPRQPKQPGGAMVLLVVTAIVAGLVVAEVAKGGMPILGGGLSTGAGGKVDARPQ